MSELTFTRSRPGNKNDGAHVEQKNWTHVRELVGDLRFDTEEELALLNAIWELGGRFSNHLLAQQKLIERRREGSKAIKRYDRAQTPVGRAIASGVLPKATTPLPRNANRAFNASDRPEVRGEQRAPPLPGISWGANESPFPGNLTCVNRGASCPARVVEARGDGAGVSGSRLGSACP